MLTASRIADFIETPQEARCRRSNAQRILRVVGGSAGIDLARRLKACDAAVPCGLGACGVCARKYRLWLATALFELAEGENCHVFTLLIETIPAGSLDNCDILRSKANVIQLLRRLRLDAFAFCGGLELKFNRHLRSWVFHAHLLVFGLSERDRTALRKRFPGSDRCMFQPLQNAVEQLSYLLKPHTFERIAGKAVSPPADREAELLRAYGRHTVKELTVEIGLRRRAAK